MGPTRTWEHHRISINTCSQLDFYSETRFSTFSIFQHCGYHYYVWLHLPPRHHRASIRRWKLPCVENQDKWYPHRSQLRRSHLKKVNSVTTRLQLFTQCIYLKKVNYLQVSNKYWRGFRWCYTMVWWQSLFLLSSSIFLSLLHSIVNTTI